MNHHYVLAPHDPALEARAIELVKEHRPGHGVRAVASASSESDLGHVIALQAAAPEDLSSLLASLQVPLDGPAQQPRMALSAPASFSVCDDIPCGQINHYFDFVPSQLPPCRALSFVLVTLRRTLHDLAKDFTRPHVTSHLAGVALSSGNQLLLELGNDDPEQLAIDLRQLSSSADVLAVQTVHTAGEKLVRSTAT